MRYGFGVVGVGAILSAVPTADDHDGYHGGIVPTHAYDNVS